MLFTFMFVISKLICSVCVMHNVFNEFHLLNNIGHVSGTIHTKLHINFVAVINGNAFHKVLEPVLSDLQVLDGMEFRA